MVLVFCPKLSNRVQYIFELLLGEMVGIKYQLTDNEEEWLSYKGKKISYGEDFGADCPRFGAHTLLFEDDLKILELNTFDYSNYKAIFPVQNGLLPFDPFAACFYLISRYEEYLPHSAVEKNGFDVKWSFAYKNDVLKRPLVELYAAEVKQKLVELFPNISFTTSASFSFQMTVNVLRPFAYKSKGFGYNSASILSKFIAGNWKRAFNQISVISGFRQDPYFTFDSLRQINEGLKIEPIYFYFNNQKASAYNSLEKKCYKKLYEQHSAQYPSGIVFRKNGLAIDETIHNEVIRYSQITSEKPTRSRFYHSELQLPETYRALLKSGITEDFSMGYHDEIGFRASTSRPFYFFDLKSNEKTELRIHPFIAVDTGMKHYGKVRSSKVKGKLEPIFQEVKELGGTISVIFHNESLSRYKEWANWAGIYEDVIKLAVKPK